MDAKILKILLELKSDVTDLNKVVGGLKGLKSTADDAAKSGFGLKQAFDFGAANVVIQEMVQLLKQIPAQLFDAFKGGVQFLGNLESAKLGIAAVLQSTDPKRFADFNDALKISADTIDLLKIRARETAATFENLVTGLQSSASPFSEVGVTNMRKQVDLIVAMGQAMSARNIPGFQMPQEVRGVLEGDTSRISLLNQMLRVTKEEMNEATKAGRSYEFLMERLAPFVTAAEQGQMTYNVALSNMSDAWQQLKGELATPIFEQLKDQILALNKAMAGEEARAGLRTIGQEVSTLMGLFANLGKTISGADDKLAKFLGTTGMLAAGPLGAALGYLTGKAQQDMNAENRELIGLQDFEKRLTLLRDSAEQARTIAEQEKAAAETDKFIAEIQEKIVSGGTKYVAQWQELLGLLKEFRSNLSGIFGSAAPDAAPLREYTRKQLEAIQSVKDAIALKTAEAGGDPRQIADARALVAYDRTLKALREKGVLDKEALELANAEYLATYQQVFAIESKKDAQGAFNALAREESAILRENRLQQELIEQDQFMSPEAKAAALMRLYAEEIAEIRKLIQARLADIEVQKLQHGPEAEARIEAAKMKIRELALEIQLLGQKAQTLSFSGGLQKELADWVNGFGTAAQQIGGFITGSINASLQATNQLLIDAAFRTGDWRQVVIGLEKQLLNMFLTMLEQMALQQAASLFGITTTTTAQVASQGAIATAAAPAAAATSISTSGAAALIGQVLAIAAIVAIMAALGGGLARGGRTGRGPRLTTVGEEGEEFVFSHAATKNIGIERLYATMHAAENAPQFYEGGPISGTGYYGSGSNVWRVLGNMPIRNPFAPGGRYHSSFAPYNPSGGGLFTRYDPNVPGMQHPPSLEIGGGSNPFAPGGRYHSAFMPYDPGGGGRRGPYESGVRLGGQAPRPPLGYDPSRGARSAFANLLMWSQTFGGTPNDYSGQSDLLTNQRGMIGRLDEFGNYHQTGNISGGWVFPGNYRDFVYSGYQNQGGPSHIPGRAAGGLLPGPPSTRDTMLAWLAGNEFVVQSPAVEMSKRIFGPDFLDDLNAMRISVPTPHFATGGQVPARNASHSVAGGGGAQRPIVNVAVFDDQKKALKWLASQEGEKILEDMINRKRHVFGMGAVN